MRLPAFLSNVIAKTKTNYELLPSNNGHGSAFQRLAWRTTFRRKILIFILVCVSLPLLALVVYYQYPDHVASAVEAVTEKAKETALGYSLPTYERFYEMERNYPQHDPSLPFPEGENGRFIWVTNQHWGKCAQFSHRTRVVYSASRPWVEQHLPTLVHDVPRGLSLQ